MSLVALNVLPGSLFLRPNLNGVPICTAAKRALQPMTYSYTGPPCESGEL